MGLFGKKSSDGLGMIGTLAGLALVSHLFDSNEKGTRVVHEYIDSRAEEEDERREREHARQLEREKKRREAINPNEMEFINERIDKGEDASLIGIGAFLVFDFALLCGIGGKEYRLYTIALIVVGAFLVKMYFAKKREQDIYKKYVSFILVQNYRNIMELASKMNCNYEESLERVSKIISKGYIKGFSVDRNKKVIVERNGVANSNNESITKNANLLKKSNSHSKCHNCGGEVFTMSDGIAYCKYCGSKV